MQFDQLRRRQLIALLGATAAWPLGARAQQRDGIRRLGVISYENESDTDERELRDEFTARLRKLGWIEGRNLHTDYRFAGNDAANMRAYARELVDLQPDVIFAGFEAVPALKTATTDIPIVFAGGPDPVAAGLVASMAQPGGNVTGFSNNPASIATKRLQVLKEIAPRVTRVALMYDPGYSGALQFLAELQAAALSIGAEAKGAAVRNPAEIEDAVAALAARPGGGLIVFAGGSTFAYLDKIVARPPSRTSRRSTETATTSLPVALLPMVPTAAKVIGAPRAMLGEFAALGRDVDADDTRAHDHRELRLYTRFV